MMKIVIITGMSGAGKSNAANILEDLGFYCVDNLPTALLPRFAEFCIAASGRYERVALVTDIRGGDVAGPLLEAVEVVEGMGCECSIIYLECTTDAIIRRYKETRRPHPLAAGDEMISQTVERERVLLRPLREQANFVIDTTNMNYAAMRQTLARCLESDVERRMRVEVLSFGYKYGVPGEADLLFDTRFLPNPYYVDELRKKTGLDAPVRDYVFSSNVAKEFFERLCSLLDFLLPQYTEEGKSVIVIGIGCTGGRHRSTAIASALRDHIAGLGYQTSLVHRDIDKG